MVKIILGDIDNIIRKKHLENCWVILTSAETKRLIKVKEYLDAEASLQGFSYEEVRNYLTKYLGKGKCRFRVRSKVMSGADPGFPEGCQPIIWSNFAKKCVILLKIKNLVGGYAI